MTASEALYLIGLRQLQRPPEDPCHQERGSSMRSWSLVVITQNLPSLYSRGHSDHIRELPTIG